MNLKTNLRRLTAIYFMMLLFSTASIWPQELPSGQAILAQVDAVINAPRDQEMEATLILIDKQGRRKERVIKMYQRGSDHRLARFLAPADQRGISVLTLPEGVIYLYLPAFKKVKRIASHVKHGKFAGTDFSYEDMEARRYAEHYTAQRISSDADHFLLELLPKEPRSSEYSRLRMWVKRDSHLPVTVEYYDKQDRLYKRLTSQKVEKIGPYWVARVREMHDLVMDHRTKMTLNQVRFDSDLAESLFSKRYLERR